jgi:hypothetical protein
MKKKPQKRGRKPNGLKAEGVDWKDAMRHAMNKPKPKDWGKAKDGEKDVKGKTD